MFNVRSSWQRIGLIASFITAPALLPSCGQDHTLAPAKTQSLSAASESERARYLTDVPLETASQTLASASSSATDQLQKQRSLGAKDFEHVRFSALMLTETERETLLASGTVRFVESIKPVQMFNTAASWGLDRIDQPSLPLDNSFSAPVSGGRGVWIFVLDTGIDPAHSQFGGRVQPGFTAINDGFGSNDCQGHGTHVAGTAAGATYGVARRAILFPVRVLDCLGAGSTEGVVAGIDYVIFQKMSYPAVPMVANLSLGGSVDRAMDEAIRRLTDQDVFTAVAAGNSSEDACSFSPAREPSAFTVGSTTSQDVKSDFSNFGSCLDAYAPGSRILSAQPGNRRATLSGTSMAAPHVAGVGALVLAARPEYSAKKVGQRIVSLSRSGAVDQVDGSRPENRLLQIETREGTVGPGPIPLPVPPGLVFNGELDLRQVRFFSIPNSSIPFAGQLSLQAQLEGPSGTDFNISLDQWNSDNNTWVPLASTEMSGSSDLLQHSGRYKNIRFGVRSASGSGSFSLKVLFSPN